MNRPLGSGVEVGELMGCALMTVLATADSVTVVTLPPKVRVKLGKEFRDVELSEVREKLGNEDIEEIGTAVTGDVFDDMEKLPLCVSEDGLLDIPVGHVQTDESEDASVSVVIVLNDVED